MARNILGNPYDPIEPDDEQPATGEGEPPAQSPSDSGSDRLVTGVRQVGGGPEDGRANGDQKSGWGDPSVIEGDASGPDGSAASSPSGQAEASSEAVPEEPPAGSDSTAVPSGGVASTRPRTRSTPTGAESKKPEPSEPPADGSDSPGAATGTEE